MYKLLISRKQIKAFKLHNFNVYFIDSNKKTLNNLTFSAKSLQENLIAVLDRDEYYRLYFLNSKIILVDSSYKGYILLDDRGSTKELPFEYCYYDEVLKKGISSNVFSYNPYSVKDEVFDLNQNRVLWSKENSFIQMPLPDIFFETPTKKDLIFLDKDTGIPLWHFSLGEIGRWYNEFDRKWEEGEVWHFVGVANGILWVDVMAHTLIGIDTCTGELKHHLKEAQPMNVFPTTYLPLIPYYGFSTYDKDSNKLWGIEAYSYWEVDLNETAPQIKTWYLGDELKKYNVMMSNLPMCGIHDNYVFFAVGSMGFTPQVCALNRQTLKIDWRYDFSQEAEGTKIAFSPTKVEVTDTHLFVLDNQGTLHIFEQEG